MTQLPPGPRKDPKTGPAGAANDFWQDWVTIWQSELSALATDREAQQAWMRLVEIWAAHARAAGAFLPARTQGAPHLRPGHDGAAGRARTEPSAGAASAPAASDAGDHERQRDDIGRLARRVEELERRLAELGGNGKG
jgi:hypothetical protein